MWTVILEGDLWLCFVVNYFVISLLGIWGCFKVPILLKYLIKRTFRENKYTKILGKKFPSQQKKVGLGLV